MSQSVLFFVHVEYRKTTPMFFQNSVSDGISNVLFFTIKQQTNLYGHDCETVSMSRPRTLIYYMFFDT